jgi:colicin import membrane protein
MRAAERPEFTPPNEGGLMRSFGMAVLAHAVLVLALSWGVKWKRDDPNVAVEAELWANAPQQAAPKPVEAPPPAPPPPAPAPPPPQPTQAQRDAEIALQKEREEREEKEKARREEAERQKELAEKRRQQEEERERERKEQARRADEKRKEEQAKARKLQQQKQEEEKRLAELRQENLKRIQGLAGATGPREATGTAMRSSGPSASYAGRLAAHFQRHVVFPGGVDTIAGNPLAVVQVRVGPTGEIMSARLSRSSGNPAWDEAAVRAIERSERIPADVDGRFVTEFPVEMRPKR